MRSHIVMFSGGVGSWAAAKRVAEFAEPRSLRLLFTDTLIEDEDLYRFLDQAAENVGGELVRIADGRTPWELFREQRFLGNTRVDICSRVLKRELAEAWLKEHCDPATTTVYVGIDWTERHRFDRLRDRYAERGWTFEAPLCDPPLLSKHQLLDWLRREGVEPPRLYGMGFPHNNCGGGCVKAGQGHFALLWRALPERFAEWERHEADLRRELGDVAILRDRTGGVTQPLTLADLRERLEAGSDQIDLFEFGGCGCFVDAPEVAQ